MTTLAEALGERWIEPPSGDQPRTVKQAAEELNVAEITLRRWITDGKIGHIKLYTRVRVPAAEIRRVLNEGYVPPTE